MQLILEVILSRKVKAGTSTWILYNTVFQDACLSCAMLQLMCVPAMFLSGWHCLISCFLLAFEKVMVVNTWQVSRPAVPNDHGKLMFPFPVGEKWLFLHTQGEKMWNLTKIYLIHFQIHTGWVLVEHVHLKICCRNGQLGGVYLI